MDSPSPNAKRFVTKTGIILGAAVWENGPSPTLERRALHGASLFQAGLVNHIVVCGGLGQHPPTEAKAMKEILLNHVVPLEAITCEDRSTTTGENIANARALIGERAVVIITDWYHVPRARLIAQRAGFTQVSTSSPRLEGARIWPQIKGLLREIPAYFAYYFGFKS